MWSKREPKGLVPKSVHSLGKVDLSKLSKPQTRHLLGSAKRGLQKGKKGSAKRGPKRGQSHFS